MMKLEFKLLTFFFLIIAISGKSFAQSVVQKTNKSFLRWSISAQKQDLKIKKQNKSVIIQSLNPEFFEAFSANITRLKRNTNYHSDFKFTAPKVPGSPYSLEIPLKDDTIELFSFYKQDEGKYIFDFWVNQDLVSTKAASKKVLPKIAKLNTKKLVPKKKEKKEPTVSFGPSKKQNKIIGVISDNKKEAYRDFRYGSSFLWDYSAQVPPLEEDISLKVKGPDFLYEVKDRDYLDDKKEAHMQLSINFYKKQDWGLMTRSINLYEEKYGTDTNKNLNDFMKAVSMIKNSIRSSVTPKYASKVGPEGEVIPAENFTNKGIRAAAKNILSNISESSNDYKLSQSVLRYLIQDSRNQEDYIQTLNYAKKLYVKASEDFDDDMIIYSSRVILNSLAHLKQLDKIKNFLENKAVKRVLPAQEGLAYIFYVNLKEDKTQQVIGDYTANERSLANPIHPAILFNTAEAFFREAKYEKAMRLYDKYLTAYSYFTESSQARLRLAQTYDLLNKPTAEVLKLYKDAINKSSDLSIRFEAKVRYVGLRVARKRELSESDIETIAFLDAAESEKKYITGKMKQLLWLTRLRVFIVQGKYSDAISYLSTLPIETLRPVEQRTFQADGAEIILGLIQAAYLNGDYAKAVKVWEVYKSKYENKVGENPYLNFIVSDSFIKLRLFSSYERSIALLKEISNQRVREFPRWIDTQKSIDVSDYLLELNLSFLLEQNKFKKLGEFLEANKSNKNINYNFYKGLVSNHLKNYTKSVTSFENVLVNPNINNILTPKQNALMLKTYLESLYEAAKPSDFRSKVAALIVDMRRNSQPELKTTIERAEYLYIESLYSESNTNHKLILSKAKEFLNQFAKSAYLLRVKYVNAVSQIATNQVANGTKALNEILNNTEAPEYLKGLARSELTSLTLKNKNI